MKLGQSLDKIKLHAAAEKLLTAWIESISDEEAKDVIELADLGYFQIVSEINDGMRHAAYLMTKNGEKIVD